MKNIMYIGLDVDDKSFTASLVKEGLSDEVISIKSRPNFKAFQKKIERFIKEGYQLKVELPLFLRTVNFLLKSP